jgi:hypothetical protein
MINYCIHHQLQGQSSWQGSKKESTSLPPAHVKGRASDQLLLLRLQKRRRNPNKISLHQNLLITRQTMNLMRLYKQNWIDRYSKLPSLQLRNQFTRSNFIVS